MGSLRKIKDKAKCAEQMQFLVLSPSKPARVLLTALACVQGIFRLCVDQPGPACHQITPSC